MSLDPDETGAEQSAENSGSDEIGHDEIGHESGLDESDTLSGPDAAVLVLLRTLLAETAVVDAGDTVPANVTNGSLWVHDWHRADAELAVLGSDSDHDAPVGTRGSTAVRDLVFEVEGLECEIEVSAVDGTFQVAGNLVPPAAVDVTLGVGGTVRSATSDEFGRFRISGLPAGTAFGFLTAGSRSIRIPPFALDGV